MRRARYSSKAESIEESTTVLSHEDVCTIQTNDFLDIEFKIRVLSDLLICPICKGFFKDAMTIRECLHTFCKSCIILYLTNEAECCPLCKSDVGSNLEDAIQHDVTIQNLVDKMFPHFSTLEKHENNKLKNLLQNHSTAALPFTHDFMGIETSEKLSDFDSETLSPAPLGGWDATEEWFGHVTNPEKTCEFLSQHCNFSIALFAESQYETGQFQRGFLRTSGKTQVSHLASYIAGKLGLERSQVTNIELTLHGHVLPHSHTLEFACRSRRLNTSLCICVQFRFLPKRIGTSCIIPE